MHELATNDWPTLRPLLAAEAPCLLVPHHPLVTGVGRCFVDRFPDPRCAALFVGGNLGFGGDPGALPGRALAALTQSLREDWDHVLMDLDAGFETIVVDATGAEPWQRVLYEYREATGSMSGGTAAEVVRLTASHASAVAALSADLEWISDTLGGPRGLAATETAFGVLDGGSLVSVAVPFYVGERYEELGVVTEASHRARGYSTACAAAVVRDVQARGRIPCWSTTPDNLGSRRVAEKLGFEKLRDGVKYVLGGAPD